VIGENMIEKGKYDNDSKSSGWGAAERSGGPGLYG
jgi:hypothetical protein